MRSIGSGLSPEGTAENSPARSAGYDFERTAKSRQGRLKIAQDVVRGILTYSPKTSKPRTRVLGKIQPPEGLDVVPIATQHCVLGYSQPSLSGLNMRVFSRVTALKLCIGHDFSRAVERS
jgi:hypothetical protein